MRAGISRARLGRGRGSNGSRTAALAAHHTLRSPLSRFPMMKHARTRCAADLRCAPGPLPSWRAGSETTSPAQACRPAESLTPSHARHRARRDRVEHHVSHSQARKRGPCDGLARAGHGRRRCKRNSPALHELARDQLAQRTTDGRRSRGKWKPRSRPCSVPRSRAAASGSTGPSRSQRPLRGRRPLTRSAARQAPQQHQQSHVRRSWRTIPP